jgi:hypothetical protein
MPRNFFNILRDNPESWGGHKIRLLYQPLITATRRKKCSAMVKICAVYYDCGTFGTFILNCRANKQTLRVKRTVLGSKLGSFHASTIWSAG